MKFYNIFTKKEFEKEGQRRVQFYKIGYIKRTEKGHKYLTLYQQPNVEYFILPDGVENVDIK